MVLTDGGASARALEAMTTGDRPVEQDTVANFHSGDVFTDLADNARAFVAEQVRFSPAEGVVVCVADASGIDFHQDLIALRRLNGDLFNGEISFSIGDGGSSLC